MTVSVDIREARQGDADRVVEMSHAVGAHEGMAPSGLTADVFLRFGFGPTRLFCCHVAECGHRLVGHVCTTRGFDFQEAGPVPWLADLYVEPAYRRRGVGRALMGAVARDAVQSGSSYIQWMIARGNEEARAFYLSMGARDDGGAPMYLGPSDIDALASIKR